MNHLLETGSFISPSQAKEDLASRLKESRRIKSLEWELKGEALADAKAFSRALVALKRQGVKISHQFSIRLDFPKSISSKKALKLVEGSPRPVNGFLKVRLHLSESTEASSD